MDILHEDMKDWQYIEHGGEREKRREEYKIIFHLAFQEDHGTSKTNRGKMSISKILYFITLLLFQDF